ncbi:MAG: Eco57I restriction-modification methylase domain-containing protein, partial [Terriglobia bacterium]
FHSWFALDEQGHYLNNKAFLIPSADRFLLALLNSPLAWWFFWRYLPHMKDEALSPVTFLMESFPVCQPPRTSRASVEEKATRLILLAKSFARKRAAFLQWVSHETSLPKLPASPESVWRLQPEGFLAALKKAGVKRVTPATLQHLTQTFEREAAALRANRTETLALERELDDLVLKAYKLTSDEIDLLRRTAPPRSPIAVLEEVLRPTAD